jgi:hypothetical protein
MMDFVFILVSLAFFAVALGYIPACERLAGGAR